MSKATTDVEELQLAFGDTVYGEDGAELGTIRGVDENGFYVTTRDGVEALSSEHVTTGRAGEAELMWRCLSCGAMGKIDEIPEVCPDCDAPKEDLYYWTED